MKFEDIKEGARLVCTKTMEDSAFYTVGEVYTVLHADDYYLDARETGCVLSDNFDTTHTWSIEALTGMTVGNTDYSEYHTQFKLEE